MKAGNQYFATTELLKQLFKSHWGLFLRTSVCNIIAALFEVLSVVGIAPVVAALVSPRDGGLKEGISISVSRWIPIALDTRQIFIYYIIIVIFAGGAKIYALWINGQTSAFIGAQLSLALFQILFQKPYKWLIQQESPKIMTIISIEVNQFVSGVLSPILNAATSIVVFIAIVATLIITVGLPALLCVSTVGFIYISFAILSKRAIRRLGYLRAQHQAHSNLILANFLNGIEEALLYPVRVALTSSFVNSAQVIRYAISKASFISEFTRYVVETFALLTSLLLALYLFYSSKDQTSVLSTLGVFLVAVQRALPSLQIFFSTFARITNNTSSSKLILDIIGKAENLRLTEITRTRSLQMPIPFTAKATANGDPLGGNRSYENNLQIKLSGVVFVYPRLEATPLLYQGTISGGRIISIIGRSGGGKTTLMKLMAGLLEPNDGSILINMKSPTNLLKEGSVGYMSQDVPIWNGSLAFNICLTDYYKTSLMNEVISVVCLDDLVGELNQGMNTILGNSEVVLSGGQRQRLGLARALYQRKSVLFIDEPTSALDSTTATKVLINLQQYAEKYNIKVIMVTHSELAMSASDQCYRLKDGYLKRM
jgi:ABC-type bacteriocin/lantibiotic exporter with double-glycine peptidase domain